MSTTATTPAPTRSREEDFLLSVHSHLVRCAVVLAPFDDANEFGHTFRLPGPGGGHRLTYHGVRAAHFASEVVSEELEAFREFYREKDTPSGSGICRFAVEADKHLEVVALALRELGRSVSVAGEHAPGPASGLMSATLVVDGLLNRWERLYEKHTAGDPSSTSAEGGAS